MRHCRTKIVCTLGPASSSPEALKSLIESGLNVARINFSHGDHETHGHEQPGGNRMQRDPDSAWLFRSRQTSSIAAIERRLAALEELLRQGRA